MSITNAASPAPDDGRPPSSEPTPTLRAISADTIEAAGAAEVAAVAQVARGDQGAAGAARADLAGLETPRFFGTRARPRARSLAIRAVAPAALLLGWWYGCASGRIPPSVLASPGDVVRALAELQQGGELRAFLLASLSRAGIGLGLGVAAGLLLGSVAGLTALGEELIDPTLQMARAVPFLALAPLLIAWFGIDETFKIVLIAIASASPMYAYSYLGVRGVDRKLVEAARGFGLRGPRLLLAVILPGALPNLLMALRTCMAVSVVGLIAAEQIGTTQGIGYLVLLAKQYYRPDYMLLCVLLYAALGLLFDGVIRVLERALMPWRRWSVIR
jgi:sulfonate transport system permease protein